MIASPHQAADPRRDRLRRRLARLAPHVGGSDLLRVAERGLDLVRLEREDLAGAIARAAPALLAL